SGADRRVVIIVGDDDDRRDTSEKTKEADQPARISFKLTLAAARRNRGHAAIGLGRGGGDGRGHHRCGDERERGFLEQGHIFLRLLDLASAEVTNSSRTRSKPSPRFTGK